MSNSNGDVNNDIAPATSHAATTQPAPPTTPKANGELGRSPDIKTPTLSTPVERSERETVSISSKDVDFLIACLQHTTGGSITIDIQRVAEAKGFKNPRSVSNKILQLKKQYDLPFNTSTKGIATNPGVTTPKPRKPRAPKESPAGNTSNSIMGDESAIQPLGNPTPTTPRPYIQASAPFSPINVTPRTPQSPTGAATSTPASKQANNTTQHVNGILGLNKRPIDASTWAWNTAAPRETHGETESDRPVKRVKVESEQGPTPSFGRSPLPTSAGSAQPRAIPAKEPVVKHEPAPAMQEGSAIKREPLPEPQGIAV